MKGGPFVGLFLMVLVGSVAVFWMLGTPDARQLANRYEIEGISRATVIKGETNFLPKLLRGRLPEAVALRFRRVNSISVSGGSPNKGTETLDFSGLRHLEHAAFKISPSSENPVSLNFDSCVRLSHIFIGGKIGNVSLEGCSSLHVNYKSLAWNNRLSELPGFENASQFQSLGMSGGENVHNRPSPTNRYVMTLNIDSQTPFDLGALSGLKHLEIQKMEIDDLQALRLDKLEGLEFLKLRSVEIFAMPEVLHFPNVVHLELIHSPLLRSTVIDAPNLRKLVLLPIQPKNLPRVNSRHRIRVTSPLAVFRDREIWIPANGEYGRSE